jgi:hypothetical protein
MYDDDSIAVLRRDCLDKRIAILPSREIIPCEMCVAFLLSGGSQGSLDTYLSPALLSTRK